MKTTIKKNAGFTLVEVIIATAILMFVVSATYAVFAIGNKIYANGNIQYDAQSGTRLVADYIVQEIRYATELEIQDVATSEGEIASNVGDDYLLIKDGLLYHYMYDSGIGGHVSMVFRANISESDSLFQKINNNTIGLSLESSGVSGNYDVNTEIDLPNFVLTAKSITGTEGLSIRFNKDVPEGFASLPEEPEDPEDPEADQQAVDTALVSVPAPSSVTNSPQNTHTITLETSGTNSTNLSWFVNPALGTISGSTLTLKFPTEKGTELSGSLTATVAKGEATPKTVTFNVVTRKESNNKLSYWITSN